MPSTDWAFADCRTVPFPGTPDPTRVCLKGGFDPALLYELVYTAKDPYVLGVGMAAMRDVISFFRYEEKDSAGTQNPIFGQVPHVIGDGELTVRPVCEGVPESRLQRGRAAAASSGTA